MGIKLKTPTKIYGHDFEYLSLDRIVTDSPKDGVLMVNFLLWKDHDYRKSNGQAAAGIGFEWSTKNPSLPDYPLDGTGDNYYGQIYNAAKNYHAELKKLANKEAARMKEPELEQKTLKAFEDKFFGCVNETGFVDVPLTKEKD